MTFEEMAAKAQFEPGASFMYRSVATEAYVIWIRGLDGEEPWRVVNPVDGEERTARDYDVAFGMLGMLRDAGVLEKP